ncbi:hypothetical protein LCGC14_1286610 [marine sediment metagenome]|uniref:Uncharacterized protein n=1 Tax=marine sediment metagenome TaxID=412755 RepID=A0A0F9KTN8_9ZZZZ
MRASLVDGPHDGQTVELLNPVMVINMPIVRPSFMSILSIADTLPKPRTYDSEYATYRRESDGRYRFAS